MDHGGRAGCCRDLASKMIEYMFGDDTFTGRSVIAAKARDIRAHIRWIDKEEAQRVPLEELLDAGKGSLLGNVLVVMRNPSGYPEEVREALLAIPDSYSGNVVLWDTEFDARASFHRRMKGKKGARSMYQPKYEKEMVQWCLGYAKGAGDDISSIPEHAIRAVVRQVGCDVWAAAQELHKLAVLSPDLLARGAEAFIPDREGGFSSAFPLLQVIVSKKPALALRMLQDMFAGGASEQFILAMLGYQFRLFLAIRMGKDAGKQLSVIHKEAGFHPNAIEKAAPFVTRLSVAGIEEILARIAAAEKSLRTAKSMDGQSIVTMLVIGLCR